MLERLAATDTTSGGSTVEFGAVTLLTGVVLSCSIKARSAFCSLDSNIPVILLVTPPTVLETAPVADFQAFDQ